MGDKRRTDRLVKMASEFASCAGGTICSVIQSAHQAKAAYRLLDNTDVTHERVTAHHMRRTLDETCEPGTYLLIEDTTTFNFERGSIVSGLGPIGGEMTSGFFMHSCLVTRADLETGIHEPVGLLGQTLWARPLVRPKERRKSNGLGKECNSARQNRDDVESKRWGLAFEQAGGPVPGTRWVYIADRESDIYSVFQACWSHTCNFVVRAAHDRALAGEHEGQCLKGVATQASPQGQVSMRLPNGREVKMRVRSETLVLKGPPRPGSALEHHQVNVVRVEQTDAGVGEEPLMWVLLTDLPADGLDACLRVIRAYKCRWLIEELHKALKTGLKAEDSQLTTVRRLMALVGVLSIVAVFLLQTRHAGRENPDELIDLKEAEPAMLAVLQAVHPPKDGKRTRKWFYHSIAKLGGFMGRKADGDPGWITLWRGWQSLLTLMQGYELALKLGKNVGKD